MAERLCGCGAVLDDALVCRACDRRVDAWLVRVERTGALVGAGSASEAFASSQLLHEGLGLQAATLEAAASPGFVPARRGREDAS
jgi:hypothetical protein